MSPNTITQWLGEAFQRWSDKTALTFLRAGRSETALSYSQLGKEISSFAHTLQSQDIGKGDRVILFLHKSVDTVVAHFALLQIGAVGVPLNPGFKASEMRYLLGDAQAKMVLCDPGRGAWIQNIDPGARVLELPTHQPYTLKAGSDEVSPFSDPAQVAPEDPGLIIYTSGTTGAPKGAVLTQQNLAHDAANIIAVWEISEADGVCHALPLFHVHGLCFALHTTLLSGAAVVMTDAFDADAVLDILTCKTGDTLCTVFMAVPVMYTKIIDRLGERPRPTAPDFSHIRLLTSGSAPLLPQTFAQIQTIFGQAPVEREGMSETGMNFSNPLHGQQVPGSIGVPMPGLQVRIVDPDSHRNLGVDEVGEIWLQGNGITPGYWNKPNETGKTFEAQWFRTGDLGRKDAKGYYYITDRIKHIIITGGENVSAKEVESVINEIDGVDESSVVGIPDSKWGERVSAAIVQRPDARLSQATIRDFCKSHLHDWKCPKTIKFIEKLPRNTMGKVLKEEVKALFK